METKKCNVCETEKPIDSFTVRYINTRGKPVYRHKCKDCRNAFDTKRYKVQIKAYAAKKSAETKRLVELGRKYEAMLKGQEC